MDIQFELVNSLLSVGADREKNLVSPALLFIERAQRPSSRTGRHLQTKIVFAFFQLFCLNNACQPPDKVVFANLWIRDERLF